MWGRGIWGFVHGEPFMYSSLTAEQQERLKILDTQAGMLREVIADIGKHGFDTTHAYSSGPSNRGRLERILGDLSAVTGEMARENDIDEAEIIAHSYRRARAIQQVKHGDNLH